MYYIITKNIITPNQYGFMPGSTTVDCLVEETSITLDRGDYAITIFLDLSKAFDTVNHSISLSKLSYNGINPITWFRSHLYNRKQRLFVKVIFSDTLQISSGVPQGSILGPLLFLLYINDFIQASKMFPMRLYADDTSLTVSGKNIDDLLYQINLELPNSYDWHCANELTLNLKMTKYLVFQPHRKINFNLFPLILAGEILEKSWRKHPI